VLTMRLKAGANEYLEYKYVLKPNNYMVDFDIQSQGLSNSLNISKPIDLQWDLKTYRNEKVLFTKTDTPIFVMNMKVEKKVV